MLKCWTGTGARPAVYMGFGTVYSRFCLPGHPKGHCSAKAGFKMEFKDMDISRNLSEESHSYRQSDPAFCVHILPPGFPHRPRCERDTCTPIRPDVLESQIYCRTGKQLEVPGKFLAYRQPQLDYAVCRTIGEPFPIADSESLDFYLVAPALLPFYIRAESQTCCIFQRGEKIIHSSRKYSVEAVCAEPERKYGIYRI